ncbi:MAG: TldD/PmbA family protein [Candidatus Eremiobacteraeota bacterium]|nr:TldD/PmbA family protein [Candidatus Eremiobacteraeota bacterium]
MSFDELAARALDTAAKRGADYADIRFDVAKSERIEARNAVIATLSEQTSRGYGIRALVDGSWGFAASSELTNQGIDSTAALAVEIAKAGAALHGKRFGDPPQRTYVDTFATPLQRAPQDVSLSERVNLLLEAEKLLHTGPEISVGRAWIDLWRTDKSFYSTIGSKIEQSLYQTGSGLQAMAVGEGDVQTRTFPGDIGLYQSGGWEIIERAKLRENAQRIAEEAIALLSAPQSPAGIKDIILGGSQVSLQIHESCGHPAELDRVMGWEANFSGVSFLELSALGKLKYGSDIVTIVIDNNLPDGLATVGYDDEGSKSIASDIIRDGMLVGYEMSNDTAREIGLTTNACVRAQSWEFVPMIRMCNLNLLPGNHSFDALFEDVKDGIYMESNRSWSIDDHRLNFQFGCEIGWEVKNGKRGRMLKNPTYAGVTPQFWNSCDAIGDTASWVAWGTPNCGKGEPIQTGRTAQCAAPARFRNVRVGVGYE